MMPTILRFSAGEMACSCSRLASVMKPLAIVGLVKQDSNSAKV